MSQRAREVVDLFLHADRPLGPDELAALIEGAMQRAERLERIECREAALAAIPDHFGAGWPTYRAVRHAINGRGA